ncbi:hypothetical protein B1H29_01010 [Streptomyces pactum]|uniref:Uncharacterized protein n=1 Tax=Streptomyces pactum TaxID=68249 RepID=A0A1S6J1S7_9ACTN|nr:hypothetical protein B1H29_01010 [Streptomyces pactum]
MEASRPRPGRALARRGNDAEAAVTPLGETVMVTAPVARKAAGTINSQSAQGPVRADEDGDD